MFDRDWCRDVPHRSSRCAEYLIIDTSKVNTTETPRKAQTADRVWRETQSNEFEGQQRTNSPSMRSCSSNRANGTVHWQCWCIFPATRSDLVRRTRRDPLCIPLPPTWEVHSTVQWLLRWPSVIWKCAWRHPSLDIQHGVKSKTKKKDPVNFALIHLTSKIRKRRDALCQIWSKEDEDENNTRPRCTDSHVVLYLSFCFCRFRQTSHKMCRETSDWEENKTSFIHSLARMSLFEKPNWMKKQKRKVYGTTFHSSINTSRVKRRKKRQREKWSTTVDSVLLFSASFLSLSLLLFFSWLVVVRRLERKRTSRENEEKRWFLSFFFSPLRHQMTKFYYGTPVN